MRTGTCREGQEILLHQTLHLLTVQLDQAVVEPRARFLPNVDDMFLRQDMGLPGSLYAVTQLCHPISLTFLRPKRSHPDFLDLQSKLLY